VNHAVQDLSGVHLSFDISFREDGRGDRLTVAGSSPRNLLRRGEWFLRKVLHHPLRSLGVLQERFVTERHHSSRLFIRSGYRLFLVVLFAFSAQRQNTLFIVCTGARRVTRVKRSQRCAAARYPRSPGEISDRWRLPGGSLQSRDHAKARSLPARGKQRAVRGPSEIVETKAHRATPSVLSCARIWSDP
jgi:hypothetical protein